MRVKVGDLVKLKAVPTSQYSSLVGESGLVTRVSPNGANLTVDLFCGKHIGLLAWSWFEVISEGG